VNNLFKGTQERDRRKGGETSSVIFEGSPGGGPSKKDNRNIERKKGEKEKKTNKHNDGGRERFNGGYGFSATPIRKRNGEGGK